MNVRLLKFERTRAGAAPASSQTPAAAVAPAPAAKAAPAVPAVPAPAASPAALVQAAAPAPQPESSFASIFEDEQAPEPPAHEPVRPPAEGTEDLEMLYEVPAHGAEPAPEPTPEPRTVPATAAGPKHSSIPTASRRAALAAVVVGAVLVLGILAYAVARRPAGPPAVPAAAAASAADDAALASRIAAADRRMSEGRLGGPDGALDNLLAAKALRPDDPRVKERLALLADTLETLGGRALDRGDVAEAEVHLAAALQAAPDRPSISAKLEALAKLPQAQEARSRRAPGGGEAPQGR